MKIKKALIPAAGRGSRLLPLTKSIPKELVTINNRSLIQIAIEELAYCGIQEVVIVVSPSKEVLREHVTSLLRQLDLPLDVKFVNQEQPLGLGHAVGLAEKQLEGESFLLLLPDDVLENPRDILPMMRLSEHHKASVIALREVEGKDIERFGVVRCNRTPAKSTYVIRGIVEKPCLAKAPSNLAVFGRYVLTPSVFPLLQITRPGKNGEVQLTDALDVLARTSKVIGYTLAGKLYECGTMDGWLETYAKFKRNG